MLDSNFTASLKNGLNVIDTSNLLDHYGALSLISAVTPLLASSTTSVAYLVLEHGDVPAVEQVDQI